MANESINNVSKTYGVRIAHEHQKLLEKAAKAAGVPVTTYIACVAVAAAQTKPGKLVDLRGKINARKSGNPTPWINKPAKPENE